MSSSTSKDSIEEFSARLTVLPLMRHARVISNFGSGHFLDADPPLKEVMAVLRERMSNAADGKLTASSELLMAQATTLDALFTELVRRSGLNMGEHLGAADRYMKLALKAQSNCRATLEALAKLHQPREQTVRHVHVNEGGQAIVADTFHQHIKGVGNGKVDEQPHTTRAIGVSAAVPGPNSLGAAVSVTSREREGPLPNARRKVDRRA